MDGWLNIYKPRFISSAKAVAMVKRAFKGFKVGHAGTLDLEAEGILPIAIGEATKLISILMDARKEYQFTIQFGAQTDTADSAGKIINNCDYIPSEVECVDVCSKFIGKISQIPPAYSALKVNGKRAYELARNNQEVTLARRIIEIYELRSIGYDTIKACAKYICKCSKGTYIRTLAEDISLSLQSLGFVIELARLSVGKFNISNSINILDYSTISEEEAGLLLQRSCLKMEYVLDDIPVLEANEQQIQKIRFGQLCEFDADKNYELLWISDSENKIIAIGHLNSKIFKSSRVFNL